MVRDTRAKKKEKGEEKRFETLSTKTKETDCEGVSPPRSSARATRPSSKLERFVFM
jgi:hypothetical protein